MYFPKTHVVNVLKVEAIQQLSCVISNFLLALVHSFGVIVVTFITIYLHI